MSGSQFARRRIQERKAAAAGAAQSGELKWIGGTHAVEEIFRSKPQSVRELWVEHQTKNPAVSGIIRGARAAGIKVQFMARNEMDRAVNGGRHQGVAAKVFYEVGEGLGAFLGSLSDEA